MRITPIAFDPTDKTSVVTPVEAKDVNMFMHPGGCLRTGTLQTPHTLRTWRRKVKRHGTADCVCSHMSEGKTAEAAEKGSLWEMR